MSGTGAGSAVGSLGSGPAICLQHDAGIGAASGQRGTDVSLVQRLGQGQHTVSG